MIKSIFDARRDKFAGYRLLSKQTDKFDRIEIIDKPNYVEYNLVKWR